MTDEIDHANDQAQKTLDSTLRAMRKNSGKPPKNLTGKCLWCRGPVPDKRRWCNADCRDEMENKN